MKHRPDSSLNVPATPDGIGRHRSAGARRKRRLLPLAVAVALLSTAGVVSVVFWPTTSVVQPTAATVQVANSTSTADGASASASSETTPETTPAPEVAATPEAAAAEVAAAGETSVAPETPGCPLSGGVLTVAADPAIADALTQLGSLSGAGICPVQVVAIDPAAALTAWVTDPATTPDVWVPDSSVRVERAAAAGIAVPATAPSLATTPVVLAVDAATAGVLSSDGHPTTAAILDSRLTATPVRIGLPDPVTTLTSAYVLLDIEAAVAGATDRNAALSWAMRSTPADVTNAVSYPADHPGTAVPSTEQAVAAYNRAAANPLTAVYSATGSAFDYPFVTMDQAAAPFAQLFYEGASSGAGRQLLDAAGFRDPAGSSAAASAGVDAAVPLSTTPPTSAAVDKVLSDLAVSNEPARLLAVLDVSGSMAEAVPDTGGATRLDLARGAAIRGLSLYSPDSQIGVWSFSRLLDGQSDHRELVPVGRLDEVVDGVTGRDRVNAAFTDVLVQPNGDTGLYDTTLAAVRAMQANWVPGRVNSVLLLTDGKNDDAGSIDLDDLLATLTAEQDPTRPVPVIAIAFGPDTDVRALQQITTVTSGATYVAMDPRQIGEIFLDAVGRRICRPNC